MWSYAAAARRESGARRSFSPTRPYNAVMSDYLALYRKFQRQDEDLVAFLNGNVVAAGFHLRNFQDNLGPALLHQRGLVVVFVIRKKDRRNGILIEVFAGQGHAVIDLACGGRNAGYFRGILCDGARRQDTAAYRAFFHAMLSHGVHLPPSAYEAWFVSTAIDDAALERIAAALAVAAREAARG